MGKHGSGKIISATRAKLPKMLLSKPVMKEIKLVPARKKKSRTKKAKPLARNNGSPRAVNKKSKKAKPAASAKKKPTLAKKASLQKSSSGSIYIQPPGVPVEVPPLPPRSVLISATRAEAAPKAAPIARPTSVPNSKSAPNPSPMAHRAPVPNSASQSTAPIVVAPAPQSAAIANETSTVPPISQLADPVLPQPPPEPIHDPNPPMLFEVAWEVCWQLGGIYTCVLRSKTPAMQERNGVTTIA